MTVQFHSAVQQDFNAAIAYYEAESGVSLADRFEAEFRACLTAIRNEPKRFPRYRPNATFRRIRLDRFPYILVYREIPDGVRVILLKHERLHPLHGQNRR